MRNFDNTTTATPFPATAPDASPTRNELPVRDYDSATGKFYQPNDLEECVPEQLWEMA